LYVAFSATLAACVLGGAGVDMNAIFDLEIALCLIIRIAIGQLDENSRLAPVGVLLRGLLTLSLPGRLLQVRELWAHGRALEADNAEVIDFLGPVACERMYLCYWAGKDFEVDFGRS
jgi:hypothetical protein